MNPTALNIKCFPKVWLASCHLLLGHQAGLASWEREGGGMEANSLDNFILWLFCSVSQVADAAEAGELMFGTVDSWLVWNLTGGLQGGRWQLWSFWGFEVQEYISSMMGRHVTDVTNASRTMLMDIASLQWSQELLDFFKLPSGIHLPKIQVQMKPHIYLIILFSGVLLKFWKFGWWSLEGSRYFRSCRRPTGSWSCLRPLPMSAKHIVLLVILLCSRQHFWVRAVWAVERQRTHMERVSFSSWG